MQTTVTIWETSIAPHFEHSSDISWAKSHDEAFFWFVRLLVHAMPSLSGREPARGRYLYEVEHAPGVE
jgi:hypothetical protein